MPWSAEIALLLCASCIRQSNLQRNDDGRYAAVHRFGKSRQQVQLGVTVHCTFSVQSEHQWHLVNKGTPDGDSLPRRHPRYSKSNPQFCPRAGKGPLDTRLSDTFSQSRLPLCRRLGSIGEVAEKIFSALQQAPVLEKTRGMAMVIIESNATLLQAYSSSMSKYSSANSPNDKQIVRVPSRK